jgi:hypothetical protein
MSETKRLKHDRAGRSLISAVIAALDDRNLGAALRALEPAAENGAAGNEDPPACGGRCTTRGE